MKNLDFFISCVSRNDITGLRIDKKREESFYRIFSRRKKKLGEKRHRYLLRVLFFSTESLD